MSAWLYELEYTANEKALMTKHLLSNQLQSIDVLFVYIAGIRVSLLKGNFSAHRSHQKFPSLSSSEGYFPPSNTMSKL